MKRARVFLTCLGIITVILFMGTAPAYSSGYPVLGLYMTNNPDDISISVVVVGKFDSSDFSLQDVDAYAQSLPAVVGMFGGSLPGMTLYGPSELAKYGSTFADADSLRDYAKSVYKGLDIKLYVFLDITKVTSAYSAQYGQNVRMDALIDNADGYLYVGSIEVPVMYLQLLSGL